MRRTVLLLGMVLLILAASCGRPGSSFPALRGDVELYRAPQAVDSYVASHPALSGIALQPQFVWLGERDAPQRVSELVRSAEGRKVLLVLYAIPERDLGGLSAGGFGSAADYLAWVEAIAAALGPAPGMVIVEPDAVAHSQSLASERGAERRRTIGAAVEVLQRRATGTTVYIDASLWVEPATMAALLHEAGVAAADGFSVNVSNYQADNDVLAYGEAVSGLVSDRHFIVDSSRNGRGAGVSPAEWCNVRGRGLGRLPGYVPASHPLCDGMFWVKRPGESDGRCNGGPAAGEFWPELAEELVANAGAT